MSFEINEDGEKIFYETQEEENPMSFDQWKKTYKEDLLSEWESFLEDKYDEYIRKVT